MSFYAANNVCFSYGKTQILQDVSVNVKEGSVVSLLGANGAGKSTLMKIMLGLLKPLSGKVLLYNENLNSYTPKKLSKLVAYVPQSSHVAFAFSALDIVLMGRVSSQSLLGVNSKEDIEIAHKSLQRLNALNLANRTYQSLSGGEKQLVLIARALAQEAKILVMDEPIAGLDYGNQLRLLEVILDLVGDGYAFLKSTHFPEHALALGGDVLALKNNAVIASGKARETINEKLIKELYNVNVSFETLKCGRIVCAPKLG